MPKRPDRVPPLQRDGNGGSDQPERAERPQPIVTELSGCKFAVAELDQDDGTKAKVLVFTHATGVLQYRIFLSETAARRMVELLTGGVVIPDIVVKH